MSARRTGSKTTRSKLNAVRDKVERLYGHRPNYTGTDVGYRWTDGKKTDVLTVRVHVRRKLSVAEIESAAVFPAEIDGVPLDVIEGDHTASPEAITRPAHFRARLRQLMGGISCGRADGSTGTAGLVVVDRKTGHPGLLSNWHVMAGPRARAGDSILHPGLVDAPEHATHIAALDRWMLDTDGDATFAALTPGQSWLPLQFGTFLAASGARRSRLGETLVKSGRTTTVTEA